MSNKKIVEEIWDKSRYCHCSNDDCTISNHRLCGICGQKMLYGSYKGIKSQNGSRYAWNIDHIIPLSKGGKDNKDNMQAVHVRCNRQKGNLIK